MNSTNASLSIGLIGAAGRMGKMLTELIVEMPNLCLTGAVVEPRSPLIGQPVGRTVFTENLSTAATSSDVLIDFSMPDVTPSVIQAATSLVKPVVCGVTGLGPTVQTLLEDAARTIPIFYSSNMSFGIAVMRKVVAKMATILADTDIEICELHHSQKKDAPSGTALSLGQAMAYARGWEEDVFCFGRHNTSTSRPCQQIGFASLRGGSACGTHTVFFLGPDETLSITHEATSRRIFALGALKAAKWIVHQAPGLYGMDDLLKDQ